MTGYSGGTGGGIDLTARLGLVANTFNDLINNAQGAKKLVRGFVDEFVDSTFIDVGASSNQIYDAMNDFFDNLGGFTADQVPTMTSATTPSGTVTASTEIVGNEAWKAFDDHTISTASPWSASGTTGWLAYQFTAGKTITQYTVADNGSSNSNGVSADPKTWTFEGSPDGATWTTLDTQTNVSAWTVNEVRTYTFTNTTSYTHYRINITANQGHGVYLQLSQIEMMETLAPLNMTLQSTAWPVTAAVNTGQFTALIEPVDPVVLDTDFKAYISNDGGVTFTEVVGLVDYGDFSTGIKVIAGDAAFAAAGTSLVAKIQSFNTKQFKLHGWSILGG